MKATFTFACTSCGSCCSEEGYVHFSKEEVTRCAEHLGMARNDFINRYLVRTGRGYAHEVKKGACCVFLKNRLCAINEIKPEQCRTFPYWDEYIGKRGELVNFDRPCRGIFSHS